MKKYNIIMVYNQDHDKLLMCKRANNPYKGLFNLVGGKIEPNEDSLESAYRELYEETGITNYDITLHHLMDLTYYHSNEFLEVYVGKLIRDVKLVEEKNELLWIDLKANFYDTSIFAGEGNIGHMIEKVNIHKDILLLDNKKST